MDKIISLREEKFILEARNCYRNSKAPKLEIFEADSGMPCGVISVCIPGVKLTGGETILKPIDGENIVASLVNAGVATTTDRVIRSGYAKYPVVKLTSKFIKRSKITVH